MDAQKNYSLGLGGTECLKTFIHIGEILLQIFDEIRSHSVWILKDTRPIHKKQLRKWTSVFVNKKETYVLLKFRA